MPTATAEPNAQNEERSKDESESPLLAMVKKMFGEQSTYPTDPPPAWQTQSLENKVTQNTQPNEPAVQVDEPRSEHSTSPAKLAADWNGPHRSGSRAEKVESVLSNKKTVTAKKLSANRANAQRSTGPKTPRGKQNAKYNAAKFGFFSEAVVIERCDGPGASEKLTVLLEQLRSEWQPVGEHENWLVGEIARTKFRFRRTAVAERGYSLALQEESELASQQLTTISWFKRALSYVISGQEEIGATGKLSASTYETLRLITQDQKSLTTPVDDGEHLEYQVQNEFKEQLADLKTALEIHLQKAEEQWAQHQLEPQPRGALPKAEHTDQIIRQERHLQKYLEWLLRELRTSQEVRKRSSTDDSDDEI